MNWKQSWSRFVLIVSLVYFPMSALAQEYKITLIYTEGGGGHKAAMAAFEEALQEYPLKPADVNITFHKLDIPMSSCMGRLATQYWDTCFQESYYDLLAPGLVAKDLFENHVAPAVAAIDDLLQLKNLRKKAEIDILPLESLIMRKGRPDMIISVINSGNAHILAVAQKYGIPFRVGFTDYKISTFIDGIGLRGERYTREQLEVYAPSEAPEVVDELRRRNIPYIVTGYPVSPGFTRLVRNLRGRNPETIQSTEGMLASYGVVEGDSILFVMMGAKGFDMNATIKYLESIRKNATELHRPGKKLHVFLAAGKNDKLREFGRDLELNNNADFVMHALENLSASEVAAFMGAYQLGYPYLMFTKPGGSTVGQAEAMGTPALYSLNPIEHERFNAELMKKLGYADTIDMLNRAKTVHPQKLLEVGSNIVGSQAKRASEVSHQLAKNTPGLGAITSFISEIPNLFQKEFHQAVDVGAKAFDQAMQVLPVSVTNQDVVDEELLVITLRKYLVEGQKFAIPPANRFASRVAPAILEDLMKENP